MIKTLYILDTDKNSNKIIESVHFDALFNNIKQFKIKNITWDEAFNSELESNSALFAVHSFQAWDNNTLNLLDRINVPVFILPTQLHKDPEVMENVFRHNKIARIFVFNESFQKYLTKTFHYENSKVKLMPIPVRDFRPRLKAEIHKKNTLCVPGKLGDYFDNIVESFYKLSLLFKNIEFLFVLKSNPYLSFEQNEKLVNKLYDKLEDMKVENFSIVIDNEKPFEHFLRKSDIIIMPVEREYSMYTGEIFDSIMANKAIVAPSLDISFDLCKQDAGIYLYNEFDSDSIAYNCSIILSNPEIKNILEEQNAELSNKLIALENADEFVNLIKRFKK